MPRLIVSQVDAKLVEKLKERAVHEGVSVEEEHRRILQHPLLGEKAGRPSIKEALLKMPNVGSDKDFAREPQRDGGPAGGSFGRARELEGLLLEGLDCGKPAPMTSKRRERIRAALKKRGLLRL